MLYWICLPIQTLSKQCWVFPRKNIIKNWTEFDKRLRNLGLSTRLLMCFLVLIVSYIKENHCLLLIVLINISFPLWMLHSHGTTLLPSHFVMHHFSYTRILNPFFWHSCTTPGVVHVMKTRTELISKFWNFDMWSSYMFSFGSNMSEC